MPKRSEAPSASPSAFSLVWRSPWVRAATYLVLILLGAWVLIALYPRYSFVLTVAISGFVIAYILSPVVELLRRIRVPRSLAVVLVYVVLLNVFVFGSILLGQVLTQMGDFVQRLPTALEKFGTGIGSFTGWLDAIPNFIAGQIGIASGSELSELLRTQLGSAMTRLARGLTQLIERLVEGGADAVFSGAASIISGTTQVVLMVLVSAYFLWDFPRFTANAYRLVPVRWRSVYSDVINKADIAVGGYLRGQLLITLIVGVVLWLGLAILGVPLALAISFLAAIFNLVPYLGPIIGVIPAILLGFTVSPLTGVLAAGVFVIANQLESSVLSPFILSRSVNVHPVTVLLAIIAGFSLFGFVGALLAVPAVGLFKILFETYVMTRPAYQSGPFRHGNRSLEVIDTPETPSGDEREAA